MPFRKARCVNSPGSAGRNWGRVLSVLSTARMTAGEPWTCSSTTASPVNECGATKRTTIASSSMAPSASCSMARRNTRGGGSSAAVSDGFSARALPMPVIKHRKAASEAGPDSRTTATPARPTPVDSANMVPAGDIRRKALCGYWFIDRKKSSFDFEVRSLSMRNSIASTGPIGIRIRRSTHIFANSPRSTSCSSLRVPEPPMSIAG